jgi:DNA-binding phage protein
VERGRAVELWKIESDDEEVSLDEGKAQPARELGINRETVGLYLRLAKGANPAISTT